MNGCESDSFYAVKSIMKQRPYTILVVSLGVTILMFAYQLRIFERKLSKASGQDFDDIINSMWCIVITIGTVGYGDIYPKTDFGKIIGVIACFWGVFIVSFFVVTLNTMLAFNANEEKSFNLLLRLHYKEELKLKATNVLASSFK